jgi:DNA polymerase V
VKLGAFTDDSLRLVSGAVAAVRGIFRPGYLYHKAGVILVDLQPKAVRQLGLFDELPVVASAGPSARDRLMSAVDALNRKGGRGTVRFASEGIEQGWRMKRERMSQAYTTSWLELPVARA